MADRAVDVAAVRHSRRFWLQLAFLCAVLGLCEAARGIVLPTLSLYVAKLGGSSAFLSFVVAAFSVGRLSASVVLGLVSDRYGLLPVLLGSVGVTCVGHVLFVAADGLSSGGLYLLLLSRALTGFGTGTLSVCRSFVSKETQPNERTRFMSWLGIVQFAGYAFTPILGGLEVSWTVAASVGWIVNTFTAGTYALLLLDVALLAALYFGLRDQRPDGAEDTEEYKASKAASMTAAEARAVGQTAAAPAWKGQEQGQGRHDGESERVEVTIDRLDEAAGAVQTPKGGTTKRGYTVVLCSDEAGSHAHSDSAPYSDNRNQPHEEEAKSTVTPTRIRTPRARSAPAAAAKKELGIEDACPTASAAPVEERVSFASPPPRAVVVAASEREMSLDSPARLLRAHSAATPTSFPRRMSLSASRPPTPSSSERNTSAPAGLTASTLAMLAAPTLPRDILSSDSLSLYLQPLPPLPFEPPASATDSAAASSSAWHARLVRLQSRMSYYSTPGLLIPVFFLLLNAASRGCLAVAETYGSTLYYAVEYGDGYDAATVSPLGAAWFYTALGAVGVAVFVLMDRFTHFFNELTLLCWGFIAMCLGFLTVLDTDGSIISLAFSMSMIYCIATPITQTLVSSMLSKQLPKQQQGKWMGLLTAAGSVGRIVFPLLAGALYELGSTSAALLLPAAVALCAVSGLVVGLKVWQLWWAYWLGVEQRLEAWQRRSEVGRGRMLAARRDSAQQLEESWLAIDEVMERMERRASSKARRKRRRERRRLPHGRQPSDGSPGLPASSGSAAVAECQSLIAAAAESEPRPVKSASEAAGQSEVLGG